MKKIKFLIGFFGLALALSLVLSCDTGTGSEDTTVSKTVSIEHGYWFVEKIDPSYWTGTPPNATMFMNIELKYFEDLSVSDFATMIVQSPNGSKWTLSLVPSNIDIENKIVHRYNLWDSDFPSKVNLGTWSATLVLTNGKTASTTISVTEPGSSVVSSHDYLTADTNTTPTDALMLSTPQMHSAVKDSTHIEISYMTNDARVRNSGMWFFDALGNYLGGSGYFHKNDGTLASSLISYSAPDSMYTYTLTPADIASGKVYLASATTTIADISKYIIFSIDGGQYAPNYTYWDSRSVGEKLSF